jgi:hypothetical protein
LINADGSAGGQVGAVVGGVLKNAVFKTLPSRQLSTVSFWPIRESGRGVSSHGLFGVLAIELGNKLPNQFHHLFSVRFMLDLEGQVAPVFILYLTVAYC